MSAQYFLEVTSMATDAVKRSRIDTNKVELMQRERGNQVQDWLRLQTTEALVGSEQWESGDFGRLLLVDGDVETILFSGKFVNPSAFANWNAQGKRYLIAGPWERFLRTPFVQDWTAYTEVDGATTTIKYARVFLWKDMDSADQIAAVVDYLLADGSLSKTIQKFAKGNITNGLILRPSKADSMMCSEVVFQSLALLPDAACWFDYSAEKPVFHSRRTAQLDELSRALLTWSQPLAPGEQFTASRQTELKVNAVRIAMKRQEVPPPNEDGSPKPLQTTISTVVAPHGYSGPEYGVLDVALDEVDGWTSENARDIALAVYAAYSVAPWSGSHTIGGLLLNVNPGNLYNVTGSRADYETMKATVQTVLDDFARKTTTVSFGPPKQLSPQDLLQRLRALRNQLSPATTTEIGEQSTGQNVGSSYGFKKDKADPNGGVDVPHPVGAGLLVLTASNGVVAWNETSGSCP